MEADFEPMVDPQFSAGYKGANVIYSLRCYCCKESFDERWVKCTCGSSDILIIVQDVVDDSGCPIDHISADEVNEIGLLLRAGYDRKNRRLPTNQQFGIDFDIALPNHKEDDDGNYESYFAIELAERSAA